MYPMMPRATYLPTLGTRPAVAGPMTMMATILSGALDRGQRGRTPLARLALKESTAFQPKSRPQEQRGHLLDGPRCTGRTALVAVTPAALRQMRMTRLATCMRSANRIVLRGLPHVRANRIMAPCHLAPLPVSNESLLGPLRRRTGEAPAVGLRCSGLSGRAAYQHQNWCDPDADSHLHPDARSQPLCETPLVGTILPNIA